ncbi:small multi-drug export protein [Bacillus sp. N9]
MGVCSSFLLAATPWFELVTVVPLGILRGLNPIIVVILAFIGNFSTIVLVIYLFEKIKNFIAAKKGTMKDNGKRQKRARKIWNKYGFPGLALWAHFLSVHIFQHFLVFRSEQQSNGHCFG